jgi:DNA polymerase III gamma/tau subunit
MPLHEDYRPKHFAAVVGQDSAIEQIQNVLARPSKSGRAWHISGASGTGKTTLAHIIAALDADPFYITELDAARLTPAELAEIENEMRYSAMSAKRGKAYIVNESHGISAATRRQLLVTLERLPAHVVFIFTTSATRQRGLFDDGSDPNQLSSRCTQIDLECGEDARKAMAARAKKIAMAEGIDGLPDEVYIDAIDQCRGNLRMLLGQIESGKFVQTARARQAMRDELAALQSDSRKAATVRRKEIEDALAQ